MSRKILTISTVIITIALVAISILFSITRDAPEEVFTGGSGQPKAGTLILTGYETPSNDTSKIPLSTFLNSNQQSTIRSYLEFLLYKIEPQEEYVGTTVPGSVDVNYRTSVLQFKVRIEKPEITYTVKYNTINDEMSVLNEKGKVFKAPSE